MNQSNVEDDGEFDDTEPELDALAERAAVYLSEGETHADVASRVGRSSKWVQRLLRNDPRFRRRVEELTAGRREQVAARLNSHVNDAVDVLVRNFDAPRPADQVRAATILLDRALAYNEAITMAQVVEDLKAQVAELQAAADSVDTTTGCGRA